MVFSQDRVRRSGLSTRSLTFQFQVEVLKIFLKLLIVQGGSSALPDEANQRVFGTFPRKNGKIPRTQGSELGGQSSPMDAMSLGAVGYGTDGSTVVKGIDTGAALLWLLRDMGGLGWCVFFWSTL